MGGVDTVEAEVRELVRRRGLDPVEDRPAVRRLVDEVVAEYGERTLTSSLPPLPDTLTAARAVYDAVAGFGPLQRHLDDRTVEEIWMNERLTDGSQCRSYGGMSLLRAPAVACKPPRDLAQDTARSGSSRCPTTSKPSSSSRQNTLKSG